MRFSIRASKDPFAGGILDFLFGGANVNRRVHAHARSVLGRELTPEEFEHLRHDLAVAHMDAVNEDTRSIPGLLNPQQIAEYHHEVFRQWGLPPTTFGGTPLTGSRIEANVWAFIWCQDCDAQ